MESCGNQTSASEDQTPRGAATTVPESAIETVDEPESIDDTVKPIIVRFEGNNYEIELTDDIETVPKLRGTIANKLNLMPQGLRRLVFSRMERKLSRVVATSTRMPVSFQRAHRCNTLV